MSCGSARPQVAVGNVKSEADLDSQVKAFPSHGAARSAPWNRLICVVCVTVFIADTGIFSQTPPGCLCFDRPSSLFSQLPVFGGVHLRDCADAPCKESACSALGDPLPSATLGEEDPAQRTAWALNGPLTVASWTLTGRSGPVHGISVQAAAPQRARSFPAQTLGPPSNTQAGSEGCALQPAWEVSREAASQVYMCSPSLLLCFSPDAPCPA